MTNELDPNQIARAGFELRTLARPNRPETMLFAIDSSKGRVCLYGVPYYPEQDRKD